MAQRGKKREQGCEAYRKGDLLSDGVGVNDTRVSLKSAPSFTCQVTTHVGDNVLRVDDTQIGLEGRGDLDRASQLGQNVTGLDLVVSDTTQTQSDVVSAESLFQLVGSFGVDG